MPNSSTKKGSRYYTPKPINRAVSYIKSYKNLILANNIKHYKNTL